MNSRTTWILLIVFLGAFLLGAGWVLLRRAEAGAGMPAYSVYARGEDGLADAAHVVRRLGLEPVAVTRPIQHARAEGLLLLVEPELQALLSGEAADMGPADAKGVLRWVARGNTLVLAGRQTTALHGALNVAVVTDERHAADETVRADVAEAGGYTRRVGDIRVEARGSLRVGAGLVLWWVGNDPGAAVVRHGAGRVLVLADPSLFTGPGLRRGDNLRFFAQVVGLHARGGKVYFDEYHHGLRSGGGPWGYLRHYGQQGVLLPVALALAVAGWSVARRLGPPVIPRAAHQADAVDYASAVARIYQLAGAQRRVARAYARAFLARVTRALRLRPNALPAEILAAWRKQHPGDEGRDLQRCLRVAGELRRGEALPDRQLLARVRELDLFQTEVRRER